MWIRQEPFLNIVIYLVCVTLILSAGSGFGGIGWREFSPTVGVLTVIGLLLLMVCGHLWTVILQLQDIKTALQERPVREG